MINQEGLKDLARAQVSGIAGYLMDALTKADWKLALRMVEALKDILLVLSKQDGS